MSEPSHAAKLDVVEAALRPLLEREAFHCAKRTCRRESEAGLIQVLNFQLGQPASSRADCFTLNLGIYLDEVHEILHAANHPPTIITEMDCEFRGRLFALAPSGEDRWLKLDAPSSSLATEVTDVLTSTGLRILERFGSRKAILDEWRQRGGFETPWIGRTQAAVGILLARNGETQTAAGVFRSWLDRANPVARPFVNRVARKLGLELNGAPNLSA